MIPYGRQDIQQSDIDAVIETLRSDFLTQGPKVPEFESLICKYTGSSYAIAVNSATSALHIACLALDLKPGDRLWTTPITFVASANCALYCDAVVDFVDIDPRTYNLCPEALKTKLESAKSIGQLPKILIVVHMCGQPCEMDKIAELCKQYNVKLIEDASHAIGGKYKNENIGNGRFSDITIFSFHPVKIVTTAEGGMALTNNKDLAERMALLRSHGITRDPSQMSHTPDGPWYYQQLELGYNYRMTELQAALGISQIARIDEYINKRHRLAQRYDELLKTTSLVLPWQHPDSYSGLHLYVVQISKESTLTRLEVFEALRARGIGVNVHYIPVHTQPYYKNLGFKEGDFPYAEQYYSNCISLPMYPTLTDKQQEEVVMALNEILSNTNT